MSNFTPGPWNILLDEFIVPKAPIGETVPVIAKMDGPNNAELRANARLIAAAPEMAELLGEFLQGLGDFITEIPDEAIERAEALLRRINGEEI